MNTSWLLLGLLAFPLSLSAAERPVVLGSTAPLRGGTLLREKREVLVTAGKTQQETGADVTNVTTRFVQRINVVRRVVSADAAEVEVRELMQECVHFTGADPPPNATSSTLLNKTLRARKKTGHWDYDLALGKPTPEEAKTLADLGFAADLLELLPVCIGTSGRKIGETWKTILSAPRGNAYGWIVPDSLDSTFLALEDKADGPHATISITGKFHLARPMNLNARMEVTFTAIVVRRLSDMLDVDTQISGQFVASAEAAGPNREKILLSYDYPFTLRRTLKLEAK